MAKQTVGIRLDEEFVTELSVSAQKQGKTITQMVLEKIDHSRQYDLLEAQYKHLKLELEELRRLGQKPVPRRKRISISLSLEEFRSIDESAHNARMSRSEFVRQFLTKSSVFTPALE